MTIFIALLRAINVGKRQVPMKELRVLAEELGFTDARTYVASGNLIFAGKGGAGVVEEKLEKVISKRFGFRVEVIVRTADEWPALRSEEHTSELQSLMRISYAVFCLKNKTINNTHKDTHNKYHK